VYLAEEVTLARLVAIKFISRLDAAERQRFLHEARVVAQIHHPNVVTVYRSGMIEGRPYLVSELVSGVPLTKVEKPVASPTALDIAIGISRGLAAAHRRHVVHCDLKPSNVMIDSDGVAKIIDFGLARIALEGSSRSNLPAGTPEYMAPEVWSGEAPGLRADVYSLGAMLFELVAGAPPFADVPVAELARRVMSSEAPNLRARVTEVDPALADVVARCLRRDPSGRYANGDELREALERLHASRRHAIEAGENPYRGLLPFEANHRGVFFGRRSEVDAVVARLRSEPIVLITGDSGVGKSSLCRAGVVPAVIDGELGGGWRSLTIVPGRRPIGALATAIGDPDLGARLRDDPTQLARELRRSTGDCGLILFIDQLEELITLGDPAEVALLDAGLEVVAGGVPGLRVLATVRADFLARMSTLPVLGRDLSRLLYFLRPLPAERLRDVIVGPAAAVGGRFESEAIVADLIAATAQAGDGGLPLLSFALADLWEARDRATNVIPSSAVAQMGGVTGALSRHADIVIRGMIAADHGHARRILLGLVTSQGTRARRSATELAIGDAARSALDALVQGRLVVVHDGESEPVYELAHECLLAGWATLRQWLDADTAGRAVRERLAAAVAEWIRLGRRGDATWQDRRLEEADALDIEALTDDERAFLVASRRGSAWRRRRRWLLGFGAILLVLAAFWSQRYLSRLELAAQVDFELARAREALADAGRTDRLRKELETRAFEEFDKSPESESDRARSVEPPRSRERDRASTGDGDAPPRSDGDGERNDDAEHAQKDRAEKLWREVIRARVDAEKAYGRADRLIESAFAKDGTRADVRDLFGDILLKRALLADDVRDRALRDELIARIEPYDSDHSRSKTWNDPGTVTVHAPPTARLSLERSDRVITPIAGPVTSLAPGSYVIIVETPGRATVRAPILVERGGVLTLEIDPPLADRVPPGFVYIPEGVFLFGHANEADRKLFFSTTPLRPRHTAPFLIARDETTIEDWLAYVESFPVEQRDARLPYVPNGTGSVKLSPDGQGHWMIEIKPVDEPHRAGWGEFIYYTGRDRLAKQDWRRFPVTGVSAHDARAYAAWLASTGKVPNARLCNELEWERAARGADDRPYPSTAVQADDIDINVDDAYEDALRGPDEVGSHPSSRSPFGLDDMAGNALEWTIAEDGRPILRGGGYWYDRKSAQVSNRSRLSATRRDLAIGFRVCASP
jgi:formylglycine-generating enzyme required for sulfatase activity